jgi:hypothetical protein
MAGYWFGRPESIRQTAGIGLPSPICSRVFRPLSRRPIHRLRDLGRAPFPRHSGMLRRPGSWAVARAATVRVAEGRGAEPLGFIGGWAALRRLGVRKSGDSAEAREILFREP